MDLPLVSNQLVKSGVLEQDIKSFGLRLVVKGLKQKGKDRFWYLCTNKYFCY